MFHRQASKVGLVFLLFQFISRSWTINVDTLEPVIRGLPEDYGQQQKQKFGYQAVLHLKTNSTDRNLSPNDIAAQSSIIVGAPFGQADSSSIQTGLVYECPVVPGDCRLLVGNDDELTQSMLRDDEMFSSTSSEQKDRQLLGSSMSVAGSKFVVCAPLYTTINGNNLRYGGKCFLAGRSLSNFTSFEFCKNPIASTGSSVLCATAVSSAGDKESESFVFGQPLKGVETGGVAAYLDGSFVERDFGISPDFYAETGYQVAFGRILNTSKSNLIVADRPTRNLNGALNIIDIDGVAQMRRIYSPIMGNSFELLRGANKVGIAVGFGFSIITASVSKNGGYDSIFVGAPFALKSKGNPDFGLVFYYQHTGKFSESPFSSDPLPITPVSIRGSVMFGRFGYAMANLGDINQDGYEDIAISAPYEDGGTIYIYFSMENGLGINTDYAQRIQGREIGLLNDINGFGTVLQGGMDVDGNKYNDLLVGSFESQQVTVLRTRPIVGIMTSLTGPNISRLDLDDKNCGTYACFVVTVCIAIDNGRDYTNDTVKETLFTLFEGTSVGVNYTLNTGSPRTFFQMTTPSTLQSSVTINRTGEVCNEHTVYVYNGILDRERAFEVDLRVEANELQLPASNGNQTLSDLNSRPVLAFDTTQRSVGVIPLKDCGIDDICMSSLSITVVSTAFNTLAVGGIRPTTSNNFIPNGVDEVVISAQVKNTEEDAFNTRLYVTVEKDLFTVSRLRVEQNYVDCKEVNSTMNGTIRAECNVGNPIKSGQIVNLQITLIPEKSREYRENITDVTLELTTSSVENNKSDDVTTVSIDITQKADLVVSRVSAEPFVRFMSIPEQAAVNKTDLGPEVNVTIVVSIVGISSIVPGAVLDITWPLRYHSTGDFLLYPAGVINSEITCSGMNPTFGRSKRQAPTTPEQAVVDKRVIQCNDSDADCRLIKCTLGNFANNQVIKLISIRSYLNLRYFSGMENEMIRVPITAKVTLEADYPIENPPNGDSRTGYVEVHYDFKGPTVVQDDGVPVWVIIVPIVVALLVIAILIFFLYVCGFFRRKRDWKSEPQARVEAVDQPDDGNATGTDKGLALEDEEDGGKMEKKTPEKTPEGSITEKDEIKPMSDVPMSDV